MPRTDDFFTEQNWRSEPVASISDWMVRHARQRYGLASDSAALEISAAWGLLATSSYNHVLGDLDPSGVKYRACPLPCSCVSLPCLGWDYLCPE